MIIGTNPKDKINLALELLPSEKVLEDEDNLDVTTETLKFQINRVSSSMMNYLRSVL